MPTSSKKVVRSKAASPNASAKKRRGIKARIQGLLARRSHRTLRLSRRRDYVRPIVMPGFFAFTGEVARTLWKYKTIFGLLALIYMVLFGVLVGIGSQATYDTFTNDIKDAGKEVMGGDIGALSQAGLLFISVATVGLSDNSTESQQIFSVLLGVMVWLVTVWLLRNLKAGHKVKLRDGLYNAGAPIFATILIVGVILVQLLPISIALIGYAAATASGLLAGGVEAMLFWIAAGLLCVLSLYWVTSTLIAGVMITLPGMYPMRALRMAGDLVLGRRVTILMRWLWMLLVVGVAWLVVLFPVILVDLWLKSLWPVIAGAPIIPVVILALSTLTIVWIAAYVYLLYRKVVDADEQANQ